MSIKMFSRFTKKDSRKHFWESTIIPIHTIDLGLVGSISSQFNITIYPRSTASRRTTQRSKL